MLDFVPNHMPRTTRDRRASDYFVHAAKRPGKFAAKLLSSENFSWATCACYGGPLLSGWPARCSSTTATDCSSDDRRTGENRRAVIACAATGDARSAGGLRTHVGMPSQPFWPSNRRVRENHRVHLHGRGLLGHGWTLQHKYLITYDKRLYDRLREGTHAVREHFHAGLDYQTDWLVFWRTTTSPGRRDLLSGTS